VALELSTLPVRIGLRGAFRTDGWGRGGHWCQSPLRSPRRPGSTGVEADCRRAAILNWVVRARLTQRTDKSAAKSAMATGMHPSAVVRRLPPRAGETALS
jgi:hypothetical protein